MRGKKETYLCKCCGKDFVARVADRKRGWARFCSKSCAKVGNRHNPNWNGIRSGGRDCEREYGWDEYVNEIHPFSPEGLGQWDD